MAPVKVTVKWGTKTFNDVELDTAEAPIAFKSIVYSLTGVPVDRQKLMAKGAWKLALKDDEDLSKYNMKDGAVISLIGTAEVLKEPAQKTVFVEDMPQHEAARAGAVLPAGLKNLGNTCYMNSTLQCLRHIPELREALGSTGSGGSGQGFFLQALRDTFASLDRSINSIAPLQFVHVLRQQFPQFAQQARGHYMQQDAEELYGTILSTLSQGLREPAALPTLGDADNFVDALMGLEMEETYTCEEAEAEPPVVMRDHARKLICNIQGGAGSDVKVDYLAQGIQLGLEGHIEKYSDILGRNATWTKKSRIARLPRYLTIQFMRFFWKATPDSQDHAGVKSKIMRAVSYPETLDVYDFCNDKLKEALKANRDSDVDEILGKKPKADGGAAGGGDGGATKHNTDVTMTDAADDDDAAALQAALAMSMDQVGASAAASKEPVGPGLPPDFRGQYELFGVVTHKGRSAEAGHYMGWVRQEGDKWLVFDDDDVSECTTEEALNLKGGGDWHTAYLAFYRFKLPAAEKKTGKEGAKGAEKK